MDIEISEKILAQAREAGLSREQVVMLLTADGEVPEDLMKILGEITDRTIAVTDSNGEKSGLR